MNTGLTSLSKLPEITVAYPFPGMEVAFAGGVCALFVIFLAWTIGMERSHHKAIIGNFTASPAE